jgi:hypothetical protein
MTTLSLVLAGKLAAAREDSAPVKGAKGPNGERFRLDGSRRLLGRAKPANSTKWSPRRVKKSKKSDVHHFYCSSRRLRY